MTLVTSQDDKRQCTEELAFIRHGVDHALYMHSINDTPVG